MQKPIRVFYSDLTGRFWATQHYRDDGNGNVEITGLKWDVTNDIGAAVTHYEITFAPAGETSDATPPVARDPA